jgi:hypothetical protein
MKTYTADEIKKILSEHGKWLMVQGGERANFSEANLSRADLYGTNLSEANLSRADLSEANLSGANLSGTNLSDANLYRANLSDANLYGANFSGANLSSANLSGTNLSSANLSGTNLSDANLSRADLYGTLIENINWLAYIGIVGCPRAYAYKLITNSGFGPFKGGVNYLDSNEFATDCNKDVHEQCGAGINLATFAWCLNNKQADDNRLLLMEFDVNDAICPVGSDGKFRVSKCTKVCECDWHGDPLKVKKARKVVK